MCCGVQMSEVDGRFPIFRFAYVLLLCSVVFQSSVCLAQNINALRAHWFSPPDGWQPKTMLDSADVETMGFQGVSLIGGRYWYVQQIEVSTTAQYVIDFHNTSVIGQFDHYIYDRHGIQIGHFSGGILSHEINPFMLRHGRLISFYPAPYTIITRLESPFFLAQPEPFVMPMADYARSVKTGNTMVLVGLGIMSALSFFYLVHYFSRKRLANLFYALFVLCCIAYNSSAQLVLSDLFNIHWFYLISYPMALASIFYVIFVMTLLGISRQYYAVLYYLGLSTIAVLVVFALLALTMPHWSLEFDRYGVAIFSVYGFICGVTLAIRGSQIAMLYMLANISFMVPGLISISLSHLYADSTLLIEHIGLLAAVSEVVMLAFVSEYQARKNKITLEVASKTDVLTGVFNRYYFESHIGHCWSNCRNEQQPFSLIMVDVDHFKQINDTWGHTIGDACLVHIARILQQYAKRRTDVLVRYGGEEFVVILPNAPIEYAQSVAEQARHHIADAPFGIGNNSVSVTISCGVSTVIPDHHTTAAGLLEKADNALYLAKHSGRNCVKTFTEQMAVEFG